MRMTHLYRGADHLSIPTGRSRPVDGPVGTPPQRRTDCRSSMIDATARSQRAVVSSARTPP
ncbi:MAG TPA: hypothetical protein VK545_02170, partial [Streptomyces sp.]|nr:hypothetical protein [Streptomyces sp.]